MTHTLRLYGFESSVKLTLSGRGERLYGGVSRFKVADAEGAGGVPLFGWHNEETSRIEE